MSNFSLQQLIELQEWAEVPPAVVQRHADVFTQDTAVHRFCASQGIQYMAYSSLGTQYLSQGFDASPVLDNAAIQAIGAKHSVTPAQVCRFEDPRLSLRYVLCYRLFMPKAASSLSAQM